MPPLITDINSLVVSDKKPVPTGTDSETARQTTEVCDGRTSSSLVGNVQSSISRWPFQPPEWAWHGQSLISPQGAGTRGPETMPGGISHN